MASFALKVTRLAFRILGALSPRLAGQAAFYLFCRTPSRKPRGEKPIAMFAKGRELLRNARLEMVHVDAGDVATYRLAGTVGGKRVMLVHGWASRAEYMAVLATGLHRAGAEVVLVDLPGHGRTYGKTLNIRNAAEALAAVEKAIGPFDAVVAHSFGGLALMSAVGQMFPEVPSLAAQRLVLIGAPSQAVEIFQDFSGLLKLSPATRQALFDHVGKVAGRPLAEFDMAQIARTETRPMLIVHAPDDKEVGEHHARSYEGIGNHISFFWADGLGHRRIVSAPDVSAAIAEFLQLPSSDRTLAHSARAS